MKCVLFFLAFIPLPLHAAADALKPYSGPSERGVDASTLTGKVMGKPLPALIARPLAQKYSGRVGGK